jgi:hypothetical protein
MAAKLQWVAAHVGQESILTCGHVVAGVHPLGTEVYCEQCMWGFTARLDQELAAVAAELRRRQQARDKTQD